MRKPQKESLKLAEIGSWSLRREVHLCNAEVQGEAISVDVEVPTSHPEDLPKRINEGGDTEQQIFNVDETTFDWKKMPSRTLIAREEKSVVVCKGQAVSC